MALQEYYKSSKTFIDRVQIVFNGLVGTTILIFSGGFFYYANEQEPGVPLFENSLVLTTSAGILLMALPLLMFLLRRNYRIKLEELDPHRQLPDRMVSYFFLSKRLWINDFLLVLIPVLFYVVSGWYIFTGIYGICLVLFTLERPTGNRIMQLLKMSNEEKERFYSREDLF